MFKTISSFNEIKEHIIPKTLIALDCDDTILKLVGELSKKTWWSDKYAEYYDTHKCEKKAYEHTLNEWTDEATRSPCVHTDEEGLMELIKEAHDAGNYVIIVTARNYSLMELTKTHLDKLKVKMDDVIGDFSDMNYCDGVFYNNDKTQIRVSKGEILLKICKKLDVSNLVFVDDMHSNLHDVSSVCSASMENVYIYHAEFH